jgi:hypothetical protein
MPLHSELWSRNTQRKVEVEGNETLSMGICEQMANIVSEAGVDSQRERLMEGGVASGAVLRRIELGQLARRARSISKLNFHATILTPHSTMVSSLPPSLPLDPKPSNPLANSRTWIFKWPSLSSPKINPADFISSSSRFNPNKGNCALEEAVVEQRSGHCK